MDSDIQFGEMQSKPPQMALRPDQNHFYATVGLQNEVVDGDLRVYIDIDVMAELEEHAREDMNVELGGVLMGNAYVDRDGVPFVIIRDSIRARHYQATRGSFKFTHETWSQITRERDRMPPEMEMVGWYHTHPGWGIFLSGMDDFICTNFFNRPLDVALVMDPRRNERGWFQWQGEKQTALTSAVFVVGHRHRRQEIIDFVEQFSGGDAMAIGSKRLRESGAQPSTTIQVVERGPDREWLVWVMLSFQTVALALLGWQLLTLRGTVPGSGGTPATVDDGGFSRVAQQAFEIELLRDYLGRTLDDPELELSAVSELAEARLENQRAKMTITSHLERIASLDRQTQDLASRNQDGLRENAQLREQLQTAEQKVQSLTAVSPTLGRGWELGGLEIAAGGLVLSVITGVLGIALGAAGMRWLRGRSERDVERERFEEPENIQVLGDSESHSSP